MKMEKTGETCIRGCANVDMINRGIDVIKSTSTEISASASFFNLIGNETRLKILHLIQTEQKVCVCDLSDILGFSISAISQQLKKLKEGNILESYKEGQTIYYSIHSGTQEKLSQILRLFNSKEKIAL